ncbi:DUF1007 family protein [Sulfitobacter sp. S190]|uniref:DUF1007 family protein n=1 Tax=Sulfitobacter sp. S190 TaxID=2867022 RepID=UPI0021A580C5|nr:DUF1007 family protein [Sulfitobacter sp. S190]UWR21939.1 DUF1007 family protein [Sulfitobacter sp. S190]
MKHLLLTAALVAATPLTAHPHIFVSAGLELFVDEARRLTHVRVTWEYDELYSLLITEDLGVDADYDGVLTDADRAVLTGFDTQWIAGFNGDLVAERDGKPLTLSGPSQPTADLVDGKVVTSHLRRIEETPVIDETGVVLRPYDGTFYTAYEVGLPTQVSGPQACDVTLDVPDVEGMLAMMQAELSQIPEDVDLAEQGFGDIGARFATDVMLTCPAS